MEPTWNLGYGGTGHLGEAFEHSEAYWRISNCGVRNNNKTLLYSFAELWVTSLTNGIHIWISNCPQKYCLHHLRGHRNVTCVLGRTIHVLPYSFTARFPNHLRKWLQEKNKPLMVVVAQSFLMAAIIAFPVKIAQFVGKPDKGNSIHLKMGKPIFSWLIVGILFSTGCTPLAQMTNSHLHCKKTWREGDLYSVYLSYCTE